MIKKIIYFGCGFFVLCMVISCTKPSKIPKIGTSTDSTVGTAAIFPHTEEFKSTRLHGKEFYGRPNLCKGCHGKDLGGGNVKISCHTCHTSPHEKKWSLPQHHGVEYVKSKEACMDCHSKDGFLSCGSCHLEMPHDAEFKINHPKIAKDYKGQCTRCHTDYKKLMPNTEGGCYTSKCHSEGTLPIIKWR
ncbi:MAG: hypothetical protein A2Z91_01485 [Deltaproteobacteria bacterium GWA2_38_16]|nr:MAG: hypothetical protein A2Z91_01485 [Deltaproteobacteria bacterium GWA2_38_16]OGQ03315.1 MAG: hypothetical protein A3D19_00200 [Deltaproteobacteria bacterium RIFCSPHIGHO2_02_FULL_38_15]OGQ30478.1 MAG: hypothetical protein A3A72_08805 [Deltaproteobacteria bacterium RIFCSPLOWO2_01_FULL_38_9]OGQ63187.1 MAG: hypothetical protein A3G92_03830 [Deltaproteobacteria bacterium RIFCSPLOWO2_12_FULL_38_8]HBQ22014.1 hypothetical protein [Deltaproteobacteria bacterium]